MLKKKSEERGKIFFNSDEYKIQMISDKDFKFKKKISLQSYYLIEEFMVLANSVIGNFLKKIKLNHYLEITKNHLRKKINNLKKIINDSNINFSSNFQRQNDFNNFLKKIKKENLFFF